jgi:DNA primase
MFPLTDVRGRVLGFGARATREEQRPKYLNTSENEVYHKGRNLYGADLARAHAARAGQVILCEGYTDVIALHQAGFRNTVGLMGTALTEEQVGELARMASVVLLALDADSAGQEAMLRAAGLAEKRSLELRVVRMAEGTDPAELLQGEGPGAIEAAVKESVPFIRFRVERVLAAGDRATPEGRDRMIAELRPVFAALAPSAMRMELTRMVSGRLALSDRVVESLLSEGVPNGRARSSVRTGGGEGGTTARAPAGIGTAAAGLSRREEPERAFLALCIASPEEGARALASLDVDEHFASELLRRAARRLRDGSLSDPMADGQGVPGGLDEDPELKALLAELIVAAGREQADPAMLEAQRLQLELARLDRKIHQARAEERGDVSGLAQNRGEVKLEFDRAYARVLEQTGGREG